MTLAETILKVYTLDVASREAKLVPRRKETALIAEIMVVDFVEGNLQGASGCCDRDWIIPLKIIRSPGFNVSTKGATATEGADQ